MEEDIVIAFRAAVIITGKIFKTVITCRGATAQ